MSGHVDTVPVDGQAWSADPFTLRRDGGRLYARGACDMKGFVAACLAAVPDMRRRAAWHARCTCSSATTRKPTARAPSGWSRDLDESGLKPALCVVGEPSGMKPILAHKGKLNLRVRVRGKPGHSSEPDKGVNADLRRRRRRWPMWPPRRAGCAQEGPFEEGFDPPHTTIHVGTIQGGSDPQHHSRTRRVRHGVAHHPRR